MRVGGWETHTKSVVSPRETRHRPRPQRTPSIRKRKLPPRVVADAHNERVGKEGRGAWAPPLSKKEPRSNGGRREVSGYFRNKPASLHMSLNMFHPSMESSNERCGAWWLLRTRREGSPRDRDGGALGPGRIEKAAARGDRLGYVANIVCCDFIFVRAFMLCVLIQP